MTKATERERVRRFFWGEIPHFFSNICISSSSFVLLLKAAFAPITGVAFNRRLSGTPTYLHSLTSSHVQTHRWAQTTWRTHVRGVTRDTGRQPQVSAVFIGGELTIRSQYRFIWTPRCPVRRECFCERLAVIYQRLVNRLYPKCYELTNTLFHIFTTSDS